MLSRAASLCLAGFLILINSSAFAHRVVLKDLEIVHPYTVEPSDPKTKDITVLMTIHNRGKTFDRLISASSPLATTSEIENGTSINNRTIDIPAGQSVEFSRKGARIELKGLTEQLTGYETFPLRLTFEKAGKVEAEVMVEENDDAKTGYGPAPHDGDHN